MRRIYIVLFTLAALLSACGNEPPGALEDGGYYVRGDKVYYKGGFPSTAFEITLADAKTFQKLGGAYARDKAHVYFDGNSIPNADASSFSVLAGDRFGKDQNHVYLNERIFSDDPAHFELLDSTFLTKDSQAVYWADGKIISNDPAHFSIVKIDDNYTFTKDTQTVHVNGNPIPGANPQTFAVLSSPFARDDKRIFYFNSVIANADLNTFAVIDSPYARDAQRVFFMERTLACADPKTFRVLNVKFQCAADQQRAYCQTALSPMSIRAPFPPIATQIIAMRMEFIFRETDSRRANLTDALIDGILAHEKNGQLHK